jgi:hypothetical protein
MNSCSALPTIKKTFVRKQKHQGWVEDVHQNAAVVMSRSCELVMAENEWGSEAANEQLGDLAVAGNKTGKAEGQGKS